MRKLFYPHWVLQLLLSRKFLLSKFLQNIMMQYIEYLYIKFLVASHDSKTSLLQRLGKINKKLSNAAVCGGLSYGR